MYTTIIWQTHIELWSSFALSPIAFAFLHNCRPLHEQTFIGSVIFTTGKVTTERTPVYDAHHLTQADLNPTYPLVDYLSFLFSL